MTERNTPTPRTAPKATTGATPAAADTRKSDAAEALDSAASVAKSARNAVRAEADDVAQQAKQTAEAETDAAKARLAGETNSSADRLHEAGGAFEPGSFAHIAADRLAENLATAADARAFARRNPLLFFGGAAALGFVAGRLLKASERAAEPEEHGGHSAAPEYLR